MQRYGWQTLHQQAVGRARVLRSYLFTGVVGAGPLTRMQVPDVARCTLGIYHSEETARVARAAFHNGNPALRVRDTLGPIYTNPDFADLLPKHGHLPKPPRSTICVLASKTRFTLRGMPSDAIMAGCERNRP
jgi:hypothetical protein